MSGKATETVEERAIRIAGEELAKAGVCLGRKRDDCDFDKSHGRCAWCLSGRLLEKACEQLEAEEKQGGNRYVGVYQGQL